MQRRTTRQITLRRTLAILFSLSAFLCLSPRQAVSAGEKVTDYQEIHLGELPIILESPHGGRMDIPDIRPAPNLGGHDKYTLELTRLIREKMIERTGKSPEMVAMLADRAFIDVNRKAGPKAYRHEFTRQLYDAHYEAIDAALARVKKYYGKGLLVLIHSGWNYPVQIAIGVNHQEKFSTIPYFVQQHGWDAFHGNDGIGGRLHARGYQVSGQGETSAGKDFAGIPILTRCRKDKNTGIDGIEFEFQGRTLLADAGKREQLAADVAEVLLDFVDRYYTRIPYKDAAK